MIRQHRAIRRRHRSRRPLRRPLLEEQPQQRPPQRQHAAEHPQLHLVRARLPTPGPRHVRQQLPILLVALGLTLRYALLGGGGHRDPPTPRLVVLPKLCPGRIAPGLHRLPSSHGFWSHSAELGAPPFAEQLPNFGLTAERRKKLIAEGRRGLEAVLRAGEEQFSLDAMLESFASMSETHET